MTGHALTTAAPTPGWLLRVCWVIVALYLFCVLGLALASDDDDDVTIQFGTCAPGLLVGAPVAATSGLKRMLDCAADGIVGLGGASAVADAADANDEEVESDWLNDWMPGFMAGFRRNFDQTDRRSSNGGGHKGEEPASEAQP